ncbi:MAG: MaoC family dehydratase [Janthinobacterium lividum]
MIRRSFELADILWFAAASGDPNPVHIDPVVGARSRAGGIVAHGLHLVLWAIDALPTGDTAIASGMKVVFSKPVVAGDTVEAAIVRPGAITLTVAGQAVASIRFKPMTPPERWPVVEPHAPAPGGLPIMPAPSGPFDPVSGALSIRDSGAELAGAFPRLGERLGPNALRGLASIATLSGTVVGGMTTEFSAMVIADDAGPDLQYRVQSFHPALRRFEMAFYGSGVTGKVAAIVDDVGHH